MIEELGTIILGEDLPSLGLHVGQFGAAVLVHPDGSCEAEFVNTSGQTIALTTLRPGQFTRCLDPVAGMTPTVKARNRSIRRRPGS